MSKKKAVEVIKEEVQEVAAVEKTVGGNEELLDFVPEAFENNELLDTQIKNVVENNGEFVTPDDEWNAKYPELDVRNLSDGKDLEKDVSKTATTEIDQPNLTMDDFNAVGSNANKTDEETNGEDTKNPILVKFDQKGQTVSQICALIDHNKELGRSSASSVITEDEQQEIMDVDEWLSESKVRYEFYKKNGQLKVQFDW